MHKAIEIAKRIRSDFSKDWTEELEDFMLLKPFYHIYSTDRTLLERNKAVCFIIYAYDPDSLWLDLKKDREENKINILSALDVENTHPLYRDIIGKTYEPVNICVFEYLESIKDFRWKMIFNYLEYAAHIQKSAMSDTPSEISWVERNKDGAPETFKEEIDPDKVVKLKRAKGDLLDVALEKIKIAHTLLDEIRKEYVATDNATQKDFNFDFTETSKKRNILSWREFIDERKKRTAVTR